MSRAACYDILVDTIFSGGLEVISFRYFTPSVCTRARLGLETSTAYYLIFTHQSYREKTYTAYL